MSKLAKFRLEALNAHNSYRRLHGVPPLEYDTEMESTAQAYAEELAAADELRVSEGASLGVYGENISRRTSASKRCPDISGAEVSSLWYRDIEKFDYARGAGRAGNFTQLVWRDTRQFGIGKAQSKGRVVVVAHYNPAGNVRGHFLENVPAPLSSRGSAAEEEREEAGGGREDPLLHYRVKSRQVDTKEVREGPSAVVLVRRELVEYEDREGRTQQKLVEERHRGHPRDSTGSAGDSRSAASSRSSWSSDGAASSSRDGGDSATGDSEEDPTAGAAAVAIVEPIAAAGAGAGAASADSSRTGTGTSEQAVTEPSAETAAATAETAEGTAAVDRGSGPRVTEERDSGRAGQLTNAEQPQKLQLTVKRNPAELHRFAKSVLSAVNRHRRHHDAHQLRLSAGLCEMAQKLAEQLAVSTERLRPCSANYRGQRLGQSLAARVSAASVDASADHVVGLWYAEGQRYNYRSEPADVEAFGNFTQLVWKGSRSWGSASAWPSSPTAPTSWQWSATISPPET